MLMHVTILKIIRLSISSNNKHFTTHLPSGAKPLVFLHDRHPPPLPRLCLQPPPRAALNQYIWFRRYSISAPRRHAPRQSLKCHKRSLMTLTSFCCPCCCHAAPRVLCPSNGQRQCDRLEGSPHPSAFCLAPTAPLAPSATRPRHPWPGRGPAEGAQRKISNLYSYLIFL